MENGLTTEDFAAAFDKATAAPDNPALSDDKPAETVEQVTAPDTENTDQGEADKASPEKAETQTQPVEPHPRWSAEQKEAFSKLPRDQQEFLVSREKEMEAEFTRKTQELSEKRKGYDAVDRIIEERRPISAQYGTTPEAELKTLYELANWAKSDPAAYVKWFAEQAGVSAAPYEINQDAGEAGADPQFTALKQQVQNLQNELHAERQAKKDAETAELTRTISSFGASEEHKHFEAVRADMSALVHLVAKEEPNISTQELLKKAYDRACYANPKVRELILSEKRAADEATRKEKEKQAAQQARNAQGMFVKSSGAENAKYEPEDEMEIMRKAYDKAVSA